MNENGEIMIDTSLDSSLMSGYKSKSQIARVLTESWTAAQMFCPICGCSHLAKFPNNNPAAVFYCPDCKNEYEQKSKDGNFGSKIPDGAYNTFIQRINGNNNPDFLLMNYSLEKMRVEKVIFVPKFFFTPELIEKRKPLATSARRGGWVGCNIIYENIPIQGRISIIEDGVALDKSDVLSRVRQAENIRINDIAARGWLLDILDCVNSISENTFSLDMVYEFERELAKKHPDNNNVRAKIRQQLQVLRDRNVISFLGGGHYRKNV